jgi:hypothetical protein
MATRTPSPFNVEELHWLAMGARALADKVRVDATSPENARRREGLEIDAQMLQALAANVQRMATGSR